MEINHNEVYTTQEAQGLLKVSKSTIKRLIKKGIIRANKVGGTYRILGKEILRAVSPRVEGEAIDIYHKIKRSVKEKVKDW